MKGKILNNIFLFLRENPQVAFTSELLGNYISSKIDEGDSMDEILDSIHIDDNFYITESWEMLQNILSFSLTDRKMLLNVCDAFEEEDFDSVLNIKKEVERSWTYEPMKVKANFYLEIEVLQRYIVKNISNNSAYIAPIAGIKSILLDKGDNYLYRTDLMCEYIDDVINLLAKQNIEETKSEFLTIPNGDVMTINNYVCNLRYIMSLMSVVI